MSLYAYCDGEWKKVVKVHSFHEGIGFVELFSVNIFHDDLWKVVPLNAENREFSEV